MKHKLLAYISATIPGILVAILTLVSSGINDVIMQRKQYETNVVYLNARYMASLDKRAYILEKFFEKYKSPLKDHARTFVDVSDKYGMDYRILPAISCMESTCGKFMIPNTYNPFGWGIYGSHYISFKNFDEAIYVVGEGINKNYITKGLDTVAEIAPVYTPPNHRNWYSGVTFFMNTIDEIEDDSNI